MTFRSDYPESIEDLKARAQAVALDTTIAALTRAPAKPKRLQLDDALLILEHAIAQFGDFDEYGAVQDAKSDLWRAFHHMEAVVAEILDANESDPADSYRED